MPIIPHTYTNLPNGSSDQDLFQGLLADVVSHSANSVGDGFATAKSNYLNWLLTQNQRQYDEEWRDNEREYTSASAQLQRLMATGMSYSAAMAALSGSGDAGSASGITQMTAEKQDVNKDIQSALGVVGAITSLGTSVFGGMTAVANLGLSAAQASLLSTQTDANVLNTQSLQRKYNGEITADRVNGSIKTAMANGLFVPSETDIASAENLVNSAYKGGFISPELLQEYYSNTSAQSSFTELYKNNYDSAGYKPTDQDYHEQGKALVAGWLAQQLQPNITQAQLDLLNKDIAKIIADTELTYKEVTLKDAQFGLTQQQETHLKYENDILSPKAQAYREHRSAMTPYFWWDFHVTLAKSAALYSHRDKLESFFIKELNNKYDQARYESQLISFHILAQNALNNASLDPRYMPAIGLYNIGLGGIVERFFTRKYTQTNRGGFSGTVGVGAPGKFGAGAGLDLEGTETQTYNLLDMPLTVKSTPNR